MYIVPYNITLWSLDYCTLRLDSGVSALKGSKSQGQSEFRQHHKFHFFYDEALIS
jgi:hypothetical protein